MKKLVVCYALLVVLFLVASFWCVVKADGYTVYRGPAEPVCADHCHCVTVQKTIQYNGSVEDLCSACECIGVELVP